MNWKTFKVSLRLVPFPLLALIGGLLVAGVGEDNPEPARPSAESSQAHADLQRLRDGLGRILDENARLKEENAQLRKENQQLRRLLADKAASGKVPGPAASSVNGIQTNAVDPGVENAWTNWLSTSSGQRHNNRCRYFKSGEGRLCGPDEGKACKLCGG